jgi:hypothetical protein
MTGNQLRQGKRNIHEALIYSFSGSQAAIAARPGQQEGKVKGMRGAVYEE